MEVDTPLGRGWVRARYLGPCEAGTLRLTGPAEPFEIDGLLGPSVQALAGDEVSGLSEIASPSGVLLLPDGVEPLDAGELLRYVRERPWLTERLASARWSIGGAEEERLGPVAAVRDRESGLTLWFARREGGPMLVALSPGTAPEGPVRASPAR